MHQLNEEVRCLRQTLSHLNYRIKHETDKETKNKLMGDYNSYNLILLNKLKELSDNDECYQFIGDDEWMNEPDYYNSNGLSPVDAFKQGLISKEQFKGFIKGNVIKYTTRCDNGKGQFNSDIDKAIHYLEILREIGE